MEASDAQVLVFGDISRRPHLPGAGSRSSHPQNPPRSQLPAFSLQPQKVVMWELARPLQRGKISLGSSNAPITRSTYLPAEQPGLCCIHASFIIGCQLSCVCTVRTPGTQKCSFKMLGYQQWMCPSHRGCFYTWLCSACLRIYK